MKLAASKGEIVPFVATQRVDAKLAMQGTGLSC